MAIPAVVGQVINLLYNIVDRIYITAFAMLAGSCGAPLASIAMGRGDKERAEQIMANCLTLLLVLSVILTAVFYFAAPSLLQMFGASADTLPFAQRYSRIYILGTVAVLIVMGMNSFLTTQGFAKMSMFTTVLGAGINIILDPIIIFVFDLGVAVA